MLKNIKDNNGVAYIEKDGKGNFSFVENTNTFRKSYNQKSNTGFKQAQLNVTLQAKPMLDDIHTGIRDINDIHTAEEVFGVDIADEDLKPTNPDFTEKDAERALKTGKVKIYSSKPIGTGGFISTSKMMASDYAGGGKVYEKVVGVDEVAWINGDEGQYVPKSELEKSDNRGLTLGALAEQRLREDEKAFAQVIDDFMDGKASDDIINVMTTPLVLKLVGGEVLPLKMSLRVLGKIIVGKHAASITPDMLKSLPRALVSPLAILKNKDSRGNTIDGVVMVVELKDNEKAVQVPITLNAQHQMVFYNNIKTAFVRNSPIHYAYTMLLSDILYINTKKGRQLLNNIGQYTPSQITITSNFVNSIPNEKDLVKLRKENPGM